MDVEGDEGAGGRHKYKFPKEGRVCGRSQGRGGGGQYSLGHYQSAVMANIVAIIVTITVVGTFHFVASAMSPRMAGEWWTLRDRRQESRKK